jgi:hypothetical protein
MTRFVPLPGLFAITRTSPNRGITFQALTSFVDRGRDDTIYDTYMNRNIQDNRVNIVEARNSFADERVDYQLIRLRNSEYDRGIHQTRIQHPQTRAVLDVNFWCLPFALENHGRHIQILEFQYRSWIPISQGILPAIISQSQISENEFTTTVQRVQQDRLHEISMREDDAMIRTLSMRDVPFYQPYMNSYDSYYNSDDEDDRRSIRTRAAGGGRHRRVSTPPPPPQPRLVEVPVERVVVETRVSPLPKAVGDILLSTARKGVDSCPIAAVPFAECEGLTITSCFHVFDTSSLARWRTEHTSCPVCRCKIENVVVETRVDGLPTM